MSGNGGGGGGSNGTQQVLTVWLEKGCYVTNRG